MAPPWPKLVVLNPTFAGAAGRASLAPRPASLEGKVLGTLWNNRAGGDHLLKSIAAKLTAKYRLRMVVEKQKWYIGEPSPTETIDSLATACDIVVTALGN